MHLTPNQHAAIAHRDGHLQLIACAGSGKTEVVARRVATLLDPAASQPLAPRNLVAFTFTDKAAGELKDRIATRVRDAHGELPGLAEMFVGTIHGFCLDIVRNQLEGYANHTVLDEVAQRMLVERHPARSGRDVTHTLDGDALQPWRDTGVFLAAIDVLRQADLVEENLHGVTAVEGLRAWRALLEDRGMLDFTAILERAAEAIERDAALRAQLGARVRHVIVDEYQDVNPMQERIVRGLERLGAWLCVVGDDDQSIFQWNGANVTNILRFAERYPDVRTIRLQENFRSSGAIVRLARDFIAQNRDRLPKAMVDTGAQPEAPGEVVARGFGAQRDEAEWIAERIEALHGATFREGDRERGLAWSDVCVLIRSDLRRNATPILDALKARGIPVLVGGLHNLFETDEARAAADLFRFVAGADLDRDALATAWAWAATASQDALGAALDYAAAVRDEVTFGVDEGGPDLLPQRVFVEFLARLGVEVEGARDAPGRGEAVLANLGVFSKLLDDFERVHHHATCADRYERLVAFLDNAAQDQYAEALLDGALASPDAVRVMTVHKAKGLQWPVVVVPGLVENRFPSRFFSQDRRKKKRKDWWDLIPVDAVRDGDRYRGGLEDERRLFYVAVTRAQRWLLLGFSPSPEYSFWRTPSQFFRWCQARPEVGDRDASITARSTPTPRHGVDGARLDFTTLKNLFECPQRFRLQTVYGFTTPPEPAQGFGASIHAALADVHRRALRGEDCGVDQVPALIAAHLRLPYATPEVYEQRCEAAAQILTRYLASRRETLGAVEFVEQAIELSMGQGVNLVGRIDLVVRRDDGRVSIVDLKSSSHAQTELQCQEQLHLYALGYRALTGRDAHTVEVWDLDGNTRDVRPVDEAWIEGVREAAHEAAAMLRTGHFPPAPTEDRCGRCPVRGLCAAGRAAIEAAPESAPATDTDRG